MLNCPSCKSKNAEGAKFCNQCGARLDAPAKAPVKTKNYTPKHLADKVLKARAALVGEKKRVTVLFADIKGSTKLAEEAGAEAWHEILDRFFAILAEAVHRYEGTINQYTGDGVMALFGAPIAHEDHAQRACFAALAMQAEVRRFADELRLKKGLNLTLRVGLNTGEVIVGRIGDDLRMDYTAQGLTVNLAARMEHICEPGHVYLTRDTANLVEGYFRLRDLGETPVEGSSKPIPVFDLEGEGPVRSRLERQMARIGSRFIGREQEMASLYSALERVRKGEGQVLAVVGNAGIGKSRLCHEFTRACQRSGVPVYCATGVPYANALPLFPVQTLTRSRLKLPERCPDEETRRLVAGTFLLEDPAHAAVLPSILEFLGVGSGAASGGRAPDQAAEAREKMLALLARWLPRAPSPQVLLIEDLHFADAGSEEFIARLCKEVRGESSGPRSVPARASPSGAQTPEHSTDDSAPPEARGTQTLLLLNYRPEYISEKLLPLMDEQVQVTALSNEQICDLARIALGPHPSLKGVPERICSRASGNPYYAEEAVQALIDERHVEGQPGNYVLVKPIEQWRIPDTVHALISARIDRLPDEHKTLLQNASVIGQEFHAQLLGNLASLEPEGLDSGLAMLEETGFVHPRDDGPEPQFRFCHPLVQEVAYQTQLESQRARAHARLAAALEIPHPLSAEPTETSVQIAHHWQAAGEWARAGAWHLHAARWFGQHDVTQVGKLFQQAIENFDRAPDSPEVIKGRIAARAGLIRMSQFVDQPSEAIERAFMDARRMAEQTGDVPSLAELHLGYANEQLHRGDAEAAVRWTTDAIEKAMAVGAGQLVHRFRLAVLLVFNSAGYPREGLELVNKAAGTGWMTEEIGIENYLSRGFYGLMLAALGRLAEAEDNMRRAVEFAEKRDRAVSWMHASLVDLASFSGNYDRVMMDARRAVERAETFGSPFFRVLALRALALAHCLLGTAAEVIPLLEQAKSIVAPGGLGHQFEANYLAVLAECYLAAGREAEAVNAAEAAIASGQHSRSRVWEIRAWVAWMHLPATAARRAFAQRGLLRMKELIDTSEAEGFRPALHLGQARWAENEKDRQSFRQQALAAYRRIGADGHVKRLESTGH